MSTKTRRRRPSKPTSARPGASSSMQLPALPSLDGAGDGASDRAIAALDQAAALEPTDDDAPADTSPSPTTAPAAETANTQSTPASAAPTAPPRDRSPAAPAPGKPPAPKGEKPKPIALEARDYRGMNAASLREQLVAEKRRNAELLERLQRESPIAQAALDEDLRTGIAETATLLSEAVAFIIDEPDAKVPQTTADRLGRVWSPIAKKYLSPEMQGHLPLITAATATIAAVLDRAASVKEARADRRELVAAGKERVELLDIAKLRSELAEARRELEQLRAQVKAAA